MKVRVTQRFSAPPERVFDAWLDRETAGAWLFATARRPMPRVEIDAREGGPYRLADGKGAEYSGEYIEIARPRRLVFTLVMENSPKVVTRVRAEIVPLRSGCELRLVHENVPAVHANRVENRWTGMLYGLDAMLSSSSCRFTSRTRISPRPSARAPTSGSPRRSQRALLRCSGRSIS